MGLDWGRAHFRHEVPARAVLVGVPGRAVQWERRGQSPAAATLSSFIATEYNG